MSHQYELLQSVEGHEINNLFNVRITTLVNTDSIYYLPVRKIVQVKF